MKNQFPIILITFLLLFSTSLQASHYHGADISYTFLGNNQYEVQFTYFIDCGSVQAGTAVSLTFEPSSSSCSSFTHQLNLLPNYPEYITHLCPTGVSNCTNPSAPYGYRKYVYKSIVTMPTACTDWNIAWYTCCRNAGAGGLSNPASEYIYIKTPLNTAIINSSPVFNEGKPLYSGCPNDTTYLSFLADDLDGDSLVYSLVAPLSGSIGGTISNVAYASGFSGTSPIIGTTSINSKTGLVRFIPTTWIRTYVAVLVEEYRNNIKIGETRRDLSILIGGFACTNNTLPKVSKVNGTNVSSGSFTFTHKANTPFSLNLQTYDVEASTGLDSLASLWGNVPTNATTIAGTSPSLNWTPTNADTGSYFITLYLTDNHCDFAGVNTFIFKVIVFSDHINFPPVTQPDFFTGISNQPITGNFLLNDNDADSLISNPTPIQSPSNGNVSIDSLGNFTYTSNIGFVGLDTFIYQVCDIPDTIFTPLCRQGIVTILVDFNHYQVNHTIPLGGTTDVCFDITGLSFGIASIQLISNSFANTTIIQVDTINGCINVQGNSIINTNASYQICDSSGNCVINDISLDIQYGVWAGDANANGDVSNFDLLHLGLAYGTTGTARDNPSIAWNGYISDDWTNSTPVSNINFKHMDCNGDGAINAIDTLAIVNNWHLNNTFTVNGTTNALPLYLENRSPTSNQVSLPIILGDSTIQGDDVYGIAFTIAYDTMLVKAHSSSISMNNSWLGSTGIDLITMNKDSYNDGLIHVALTRIDGQSMDGFGQIGNYQFTMKDNNLLTDSLFLFEIGNIKAITHLEQPIDISPTQTILNTIITNTNQISLGQFINVFPNPTSDILNIKSEDLIIKQITLTSISGQVLETKLISDYQTEINIQHLPNGIYTLSIETDKGWIYKKVNVLK